MMSFGQADRPATSGSGAAWAIRPRQLTLSCIDRHTDGSSEVTAFLLSA